MQVIEGFFCVCAFAVKACITIEIFCTGEVQFISMSKCIETESAFVHYNVILAVNGNVIC